MPEKRGQVINLTIGYGKKAPDLEMLNSLGLPPHNVGNSTRVSFGLNLQMLLISSWGLHSCTKFITWSPFFP